MRSLRQMGLAFIVLLSLTRCSNNPYPPEDQDKAVYTSSFDEPPKTLDPGVAYTVDASRFLVLIYETLLEYHYLKRPLELIPGLAKYIPTEEKIPLPDGREGVAYTFEFWEDSWFHEDPCFATPDEPNRRTRELVAEDFEFAFKRLSDFELNCPVYEPFSKILGFAEWTDRLQALRKDPVFKAKGIIAQYAEAGPIPGFEILERSRFRIILSEPYPQILYWLAMNFSSPVPAEAVIAYDGQAGRDSFAEHPVGTGPYRMVLYDKEAKIVLEAHPRWRGQTHQERRSPGTVYPSDGSPEDAEQGLLAPDLLGAPLPFIPRLEYRVEKEALSRFNKFRQGYYDDSGIPKESFSAVVREDRLSEDMIQKGIRLYKSVGLDVFYIGFNMDDDLVGAPAAFKDPNKQVHREEWLNRNRALRQAMSLAYDAESERHVFSNGRGLLAQSPLPPGIFGYDPAYQNPYRQFDPALVRAKALLREAGYPDGVDPSTGKPLVINFDVGDTATNARIFFEFHVNCWRKLGLDVRVQATTYNQFQQKMREGSYQIFRWGWVADYPDPENFLFLLYGPMGRAYNNGPNSANFNDPRVNALFESMKSLKNDGTAEMDEQDPAGAGVLKISRTRLEIIRSMLALIEEECPWIPVSHSESYDLVHGWYQNIKPPAVPCDAMKYRKLNAGLRASKREEWNPPVLWPLFLIIGAGILLILPAIRTYLRERT